ncbi:MAG: dethiobiotin synthase [Puia sp.]|nr:dethiobiotin synthase [Puia sp.]
MTPIFITGIGTAVGKTIVAAVVTEALQADYWKPVQTGYGEGTDSDWIRSALSNPVSEVHQEAYSLALPASPHIAAREEGVTIDLTTILERYREITESAAGLQTPHRYLVIEGAGGLLVPLNDTAFMLDLVKALQTDVILVSRNYLGSINHSLLTASLCKAHGLAVIGWVFNDHFLQYEDEIRDWSGIPAIASLPPTARPDRVFIQEQADRIRPRLQQILSRATLL